MLSEKSRILIIDDNKDLLFNLELLLKFNGYDVLKAFNGKEALDILNLTNKPPDLIICDIVMPLLDGYSLFKKIVHDIRWSSIPFLFLTAKASTEDIILGKKLGIDEYITKPFDNNYLLNIISGKIKRKKIEKSLNTKIERKLKLLGELKSNNSIISRKEDIKVIYLCWDDIRGSVLKKIFPPTEYSRKWFEELGIQLFQTTVAVYGHGDCSQANSALLNVNNINMDAVVYFDFIVDNSVRGDQKQYMLALLAPKVDYFSFLEIRMLFDEISNEIKSTGNCEIIKKNWEYLTHILTNKEESSLVI